MKQIIRFLIIALLFGPVTGQSAEFDSILTCLGQEELKLHKNHQLGPVYILNQTLINELAAIGQVPIKKKYLQDICEAKRLPISVRLIESILIERDNMFITERQPDETEHFLKMRLSNLDTLINETPHILYRYLAALQAQTPYPHCLNEKIPHLKEFTHRMRHLEEDFPIEKLMSDKKVLRSIFSRLRNYSTILQECALLEVERVKQSGRKTNP